MCLCIYIHACIHTYPCIYMHTCIHAYMPHSFEFSVPTPDQADFADLCQIQDSAFRVPNSGQTPRPRWNSIFEDILPQRTGIWVSRKHLQILNSAAVVCFSKGLVRILEPGIRDAELGRDLRNPPWMRPWFLFDGRRLSPCSLRNPHFGRFCVFAWP